MFSVCRVPGHQSDSLSPEPESNSPYARQVVVLIHDYFYTIEVYDESWSRISPDRIEKLLFACVRDVGYRLNSTAEPATPIGLLTADDRGVWAEVRYLFPIIQLLAERGILELFPAARHISEEPKNTTKDP